MAGKRELIEPIPMTSDMPAATHAAGSPTRRLTSGGHSLLTGVSTQGTPAKPGEGDRGDRQRPA